MSFRLPARSGFAAGVFFACLIAFSIVTGVVITLQAGYGLQAFGGVAYTPHILGLAIPRVQAAHVAGMSAGLAFVGWAHRRGPGEDLGPWWARLGVVWALLVAAVVPAAMLLLFVSHLAASAAYGLTREAFTAGISMAATPADVAYGLAKGSAYGVLLGAFAAGAGPRIAKAPWRLRWKLALAWLGLGLGMALVDIVMDPSLTRGAPLPGQSKNEAIGTSRNHEDVER